ncbi:MAG: hypothetical protein LBL65_03125 [Campylobacteraceae bacterium]|jgi:hypothetical protein|nr:hypothetical protein [Campylobacteraceae bacterium]
MSERVTIVDNEIDIFVNALRSLGAGGFMKEATENLKKAIREAAVTKKSATITMRVTVKSDEEGEIVLLGNNMVQLPRTLIKARYFISPKTILLSNAHVRNIQIMLNL